MTRDYNVDEEGFTESENLFRIVLNNGERKQLRGLSNNAPLNTKTKILINNRMSRKCQDENGNNSIYLTIEAINLMYGYLEDLRRNYCNDYYYKKIHRKLREYVYLFSPEGKS